MVDGSLARMTKLQDLGRRQSIAVRENVEARYTLLIVRRNAREGNEE